MNLFLLRHADADTPAPRDDQRRLSEKGIEQTRRVARFCQAHALMPEWILTSPIIRARETAEIFAAETGSKERVESARFLACGMKPEIALRELESRKEKGSVMLVGHEPDFGLLVTHLLGIRAEGRLHLRKASLTLLEVAQWEAGHARLDFSIPARLMG